MSRADPDAAPKCAVVVPIRSFADAKQRLADVLDDHQRIELMRTLAHHVLEVASTCATVVVTSDREVRELATGFGADVLADPGSLDAAATLGQSWARDRGFARVVVVHADLPYLTDLAPFAAPADQPVCVLVPDQRHDGTPILSIPTATSFEFAYGPGSFERHERAAERCGLLVTIPLDVRAGFDIDLPDDLAALHPTEPR